MARVAEALIWGFPHLEKLGHETYTIETRMSRRFVLIPRALFLFHYALFAIFVGTI